MLTHILTMTTTHKFPSLVVDGGPDVDGLAGHVAAPVQAHPARDRPGGQAGHAQSVLDLAMERLLQL